MTKRAQGKKAAGMELTGNGGAWASCRRVAVALALLAGLPGGLALRAQDAAPAAPRQIGPRTMARVQAAGELRCGLNREEPEYSNLDMHGNRALLDVDLCKAVAIAVLGPKARFSITPYPDEADSLRGLKAGAVDLLATASPTLTNRAGLGLAFGPVMLWDHLALMGNNALGVHTARDLDGKKICYLTETEMELGLTAWMAREHIAFLGFPFQEEGEMEAAFLTGNCAAIAADWTQLAYERIAFRAKGRDYEILPDVLEMDPLATATRGDDAAWSQLVRWVETSLLATEEKGLTTGNAEERRSAIAADAARGSDLSAAVLLGVVPGLGRPLGLDDGWALRVLRGVGNYGEIYARDLGPATPMRVERGLDRLVRNGGLMTAEPMR